MLKKVWLTSIKYGVSGVTCFDFLPNLLLEILHYLSCSTFSPFDLSLAKHFNVTILIFSLYQKFLFPFNSNKIVVLLHYPVQAAQKLTRLIFSMKAG